jgi:hypothetical protein
MQAFARSVAPTCFASWPSRSLPARIAAGHRVRDLDARIYALDSTAIDLCLSLFDGAPFRSTKGTTKLHTLLDGLHPKKWTPTFEVFTIANGGVRCRGFRSGGTRLSFVPKR